MNKRVFGAHYKHALSPENSVIGASSSPLRDVSPFPPPHPLPSATTTIASTAAAAAVKDLDPYSVPRQVGMKRDANPRVFLDISTMIAMTSSLCNGHSQYVFEVNVLPDKVITLCNRGKTGIAVLSHNRVSIGGG